MDVKIEPDVDVTIPIVTSNEDLSSGDLLQSPFHERNLLNVNHESSSVLNTNIKQEITKLSEYSLMHGPQRTCVVKRHIDETNIELILTNLDKLKCEKSIVLPSVVDLKSNKEKKCYKCSVCNHVFSYRRQLICHLRTHTGEKPYSCSWCDYKSTQKVNLTCHIRRNHTGEKPYSCISCDFKSATKYQLICHVRIHTGEKPFSCFFCDYRCAHKVDMIRHMRTHTGEKPFACTFCDHRCADKRDLTHHVRTHTGEKPYTCNFCDYKCIKKSYLNAHVKIHTGEKPFCCSFCDYKCSRRAVLSRHLKTHAAGKRVRKGLGLKTVQKTALQKCPIKCDLNNQQPESNLVVGRVDVSQLNIIKIEELAVKEETIDVQYL